MENILKIANAIGKRFFYTLFILVGILIALYKLIVEHDVVRGVGGLALGALLVIIIEVMWRRSGRFN